MTDPSISTLEIVRARLADGRTIADHHVHQLVAEIDRLRGLFSRISDLVANAPGAGQSSTLMPIEELARKGLGDE